MRSDGCTATAFLSTPSGWRATHDLSYLHPDRWHFYPRPPGGGRLLGATTENTFKFISIHALRVEGDNRLTRLLGVMVPEFLSTPSGWRATGLGAQMS